MRALITAELVRETTGPCEVWDTKIPGFLLRVRESGHASYAVVYGRGKKVTIGRADALKPAEARELARGIIGDVAHGKDIQAERRKRKAGTLRAFIDSQYGPWVTTNRKSGPSSLARLLTFPDSILNRPLAELSAFQLEQWRSQRRKADIQDSTINRDLDALRGVLSKAVEWKLITDHPMRHVKRAKVDAIGRLRYLSADEEARLRAALVAREASRQAGRERFNAWRTARGYKTLPAFGVYSDHIAPLTLLALNTGLRRGELLGLAWGDVDLLQARLTVRGASAKSGLTRYVPLNSEAVSVLRAWMAADVEGSALIFPGPGGGAMFSLKTAWQKVAKAAKLDAFTFHDLRHTFASKLVQAGVDLNTVRELLGHADIKMTLRYSHLAPEHRAAAVAKLVTA